MSDNDSQSLDVISRSLEDIEDGFDLGSPSSHIDDVPLIYTHVPSHHPQTPIQHYSTRKNNYLSTFISEHPYISFILAMISCCLFAVVILFIQGHIVITSIDDDKSTSLFTAWGPNDAQIPKGSTIHIDAEALKQMLPPGSLVTRAPDGSTATAGAGAAQPKGKDTPSREQTTTTGKDQQVVNNAKTSDGSVFTRLPHMLAVSRHGGTTQDLVAIGETMGWKVSEVSLASFLPFGQNQQKAQNNFFNSEIIQALCRDYDVIGVSDVIWDGWMFLHYPSCHAKLLFVTTNRFDILLEDNDRAQWHRDLNAALEANNWNYPVITANNPYEQFFMERHEIEFPQNDETNPHPDQFSPSVPLIRSLGLSSVPLDTSVQLVAHPPACLYYNHDQGSERVYRKARIQGLQYECKLFKLPYGGPTFIRKHNAPFIFVPYQVSVMKMWESVRAGIVMLIPSLKFLSELVHIDYNAFRLVGDPIQELTQTFGSDMTSWQHYIDFYNTAFEPCLVQFNSWTELNTIIKDKTWRQQEQICRDYSRLFPASQLVLWHKLFQQRFPQLPRAPMDELQREAAEKYHLLEAPIPH